MDVIETVNALFEDIYKEYIIRLGSNSDEELYKILMKKRRAVLCIIATNPINTENIFFLLISGQMHGLFLH